MKINVLFRILSFVLIVALVSIAVMAFLAGHFVLFWSVETLTIGAIAYMLFFHRRVIKPMQIIGDGMDLLREQDFGSRLRLVGQPEADRIVLIFNRMMEQLKEERIQVRETNHFLDLLIEASPLGVIILGFDERIFSVNPAVLSFLSTFSANDLIGKKLHEIDNILISCLLRMKSYQSEIIRLSDATVYKCTHSRFVDRGHPHSFYLIEMLTEEVFKAEKKAYEQVIRMISHEVNNTTAGVIATLDAVRQSFDETTDLQEALKVTIERCYGMNRFITGYADVVRIPEPQIAPCNLNELAAGCARFMEPICRDNNIRIVLNLSDSEIVVPIDARLFEQAAVNIVKNAVEAIESGGEIGISTFSEPVALEIADNGKGIAQETESKLFTPFFSTKPDGQGLGLIFTREVLQKHNCTFSLRTGHDGWTRFRIQW
ncbi:MAG: PAS domain-containing sensor histidine kinase [Tannerella sp.]|jgi:nitrogen fixation/metabolism regulation signal transduction histidine kinase|nr:PAS domain-containing sensor histidine kinase [Tannerella sp.]